MPSTVILDTDLPMISRSAPDVPLLSLNDALPISTFTGLDNCEGVFTPLVNTTGPTNTGCAYTQTRTAHYSHNTGQTPHHLIIPYTFTFKTEKTVTKSTAPTVPLTVSTPTISPLPS